jgi:uncharacterized cupredoxin-like copper-binding protein
MIRRVAVAILIGLLSPATAKVGPDAELVTLRLSSFAFAPDQLRLRSGVPVRLHLVNDSDGSHNFSAPTLFLLASTFPDAGPPPGGKVEVASKGSADILFVPRSPGTYKFECTHFLHALFGMTGSIVVE